MRIKLSPSAVHSGAALASLLCAGKFKVGYFLDSPRRCHSWIGHTIRHNEFVINIFQGVIFGKKAMGRPRLQYLKQVARNRGADSYTAMKRMACNKSRRKVANQSKD